VECLEGANALAKQVLSQLSYTPTVGVTFILKHLPPFRIPILRNIATAGAGSHFVATDTAVLRAKAGTPITMSVDEGCCGVPFAFPYNLYVTVEQLPEPTE
jgi:hypothetical protein